MAEIPEKIIIEWVSKKQHIQNRLNKIKKRLKKYSKQERHFEFRMQMIKKYEKKIGESSNG